MTEPTDVPMPALPANNDGTTPADPIEPTPARASDTPKPRPTKAGTRRPKFRRGIPAVPVQQARADRHAEIAARMAASFATADARTARVAEAQRVADERRAAADRRAAATAEAERQRVYAAERVTLMDGTPYPTTRQVALTTSTLLYRHDTVCAVCQRSVPRVVDGIVSSIDPWGQNYGPAARLCADCAGDVALPPLLGYARALRSILGPDSIPADDVLNRAEFRAVVEARRVSVRPYDYPTPWAAGAGDLRWSHLRGDDGEIYRDRFAELVEPLNRLAAELAAGPQPSPSGKGCSGCGVATAWAWSNVPSIGYLCSVGPHWRSGGEYTPLPCHDARRERVWGDAFPAQVLAGACGLVEPTGHVKTPSDLMAGRRFATYAAAHPGGPGTPDRWGYLDTATAAAEIENIRQDFADQLPPAQRAVYVEARRAADAQRYADALAARRAAGPLETVR